MPASEVRDDLARITSRREELEALLDCTSEEPVLLHPKLTGYYSNQVENLAAALNADENHAEAADLLRSLVDRITLTPNDEGKLDNIWREVAIAIADRRHLIRLPAMLSRSTSDS